MEDLTLNYTGIGSLPLCGENAPEYAINTVFENYPDIPFWAQLPCYSQKEDMVYQFLDGLNLFFTDEKCYCKTSDNNTENINNDFKKIISSNNLETVENILDKYAIKEKSASTFRLFTDKLKYHRCNYAKSCVTGAFTTSFSIYNENKKLVYFDKNLRDVISKLIAIKALWQIKEIKKSNKNIKPIIFIDEPSVSQLNSPLFSEVKTKDIITMIKLISDTIKKYGALSGLHCCGDMNWNIALKINPDIINFDCYNYSYDFSKYINEIKDFIAAGRIFALGVIPTNNNDILNLKEQDLAITFEKTIKNFEKYGIDKKKLITQTMITSTCGCAALSYEGAQRVAYHTKKLSASLKEKYKEIL